MTRSAKFACALLSLSCLFSRTTTASAQTSGQLTFRPTTGSHGYGTYEVYGTASVFGNISNNNVWVGGDASGSPLFSGQVLNIQPGATITVDFYNQGYTGVYVWGTDQINMSGGTVTRINASDSSTVNVSGGSIQGLEIAGSATANLSNGTFNNIGIGSTSNVTFSGGTYQQVNYTGGTLSIVGYGLTMTKGDAFIGPAAQSGYYYDVTGRLANNITAGTFRISNSSNSVPILVDAAAPEPTSLGLLSATVPVALSLRQRRRKKSEKVSF